MATKSEYAPIDIPNTDLWDLLFERKTEFPSNKDTPALTWGTLWANGVVSPANPAYSVSELSFQLKDSGAKAVLTQEPFLETVLEAAKNASIPRSRILLIGDGTSVNDVKHFTDLIRAAGDEVIHKRSTRSPTDLAYLVYSSGTTGLPKGVMLTQRNIVAQVLMLTVAQSELSWKDGPRGSGDTVLAVLPFYHIYDYKITYGYVVPPILLSLSKSPLVEEYDLSSIRMLASGAAPLTRDLVDAVWKRLKIKVKQAYGLSETSPATHIQRYDDWQTTVGSVGRLLPNQVAKYMSPSETALPSGSTGELWIKGPNVFAGYLNNPSATANALTEDGYFKTGDVGFQDAQGNFYITDRIKELIKYKGFQVAPAELEGLLIGHEKVADACVVGVYDARQATEVPRAFIVTTESGVNQEVLAKEITTWLDARVAKHKKLRGGICFVDEIPKTASGKILRRILKDRASGEEVRRDGRPKL
ncbi:MAG: hypothetical protein Q9161_007276 [Pseudevernia consocians]